MKKIFFLPALFVLLFSTNSFAQFEGKISYTFQEIGENSEKDKEKFSIYFTPDRILLQPDEAMNMAGSFKTGGLLIRLDKKDFVFMTGDKTAMTISKAGITSFMNMFGEMAAETKKGAGGSEEDIKANFTFEKTEETKTINGYEAHKFVFKSKGEESGKGIIWMTSEININWGMLAEPWGDSVSFLTNRDLPTKYIFEKGWVPLKAAFYEGGQVSGRMTTVVKETDIPKSMVRLSSDIQVRSLSEYMFQMMRQQQ